MVAAELSKIIVVAVNVVFMIFGLGILVIGIIFKLGWDDVRNAFDDTATKVDFDLRAAGDAVGVAAITFGCIILVVALLGCAGACCDNRCMVGTYAVIVAMVLVGQVAVVALVATQGNKAEDKLQEALIDTLKNYTETSSTDVSRSWSAIFDLGDCCAVTDYKVDFSNNAFVKAEDLRKKASITGTLMPITCCKGVSYEDKLTEDIFKDKKACLDNPTEKNAYTKGCYNKIQDWIDEHKKILIGVGIGVLVFELILSLMAFFLCCRSKDH